MKTESNMIPLGQAGHRFTRVMLRRVAFVALGLGIFSAAAYAMGGSGSSTEQMTATVATTGAYHRLVLLKFSESATEADMATVKEQFCALGRSYPGLEKAVWVEDPSICPKSAYTHAVILTFSCPQAAANYREHPQCQAFAKTASTVVASQMEMQYTTCAANVSGPAS